jgi:hypothetical protein
MANIAISTTRQRTVIRDLKSEKIYAYDYDNAYPQRIYDLVNSSGTAKQGWNKFAKFVMGNGVVDPQLSRKIVNKYGVTVEKLIRFGIDDYCLYYGFAVHVSYNALGDIIAYNTIPFEYCRLAFDGTIAVYDNWDRRKLKDNGRYNVSDIKYFPRFNPAKVIGEIDAMTGNTLQEKMAAYPGQVFWYSRAGLETYPLSPFDPVLEDIETDAEIKIGKLKNVKTNFLAAQMVKYRGKFESPQAKSEFLESLEMFQGNENLGNLMLVELEDGQADFDVTPFTIQDFDKKWEYTERSVQENIIRVLQQPQVLSTMAVAGKLGTSSEIDEAKAFYNDVTADDRLVIEEEFTRLLGRQISIIPITQKSNGTTTNQPG